MRKLFLAMAAMATLLTSCSKDETTTATLNQRAKVTFSVSAPELETRATTGDGLTATDLEYVIYDLAEESANGANQISGMAKFDDGSRITNVNVDLVEGRTYEAIFFAKAPESPYTFNKTEQNMTIDTDKLMANAEEYDAFYKYVEPFTIQPTDNEIDVKMTRPFAQLNIAADDCNTDAGKMIDAATTGVELQAYTTLNFKDGTVSDKKTITYGLAERMDGEITANGESYNWLTMNYILVNSQELVDVEFFFTDEPNNGAENPLMRTYAKVPVERNHRTNIIGSILTNPTQFKVEIVPGFEDPEHVYDVDATEEIVVKTAADLQEAIDNAGEGTTVIKLDANITTQTTRAAAAAVKIPQKEGVNLVIDGGGHTYNGTIYVDGNGRLSGTETLTFTDIKFEISSASGTVYFIDSNESYDPKNGSNYNYAHNVTIENCTFNNTNASLTVDGMRFRQAANIRIVNCEVKDNIFALIWATGCDGITIDGVNAANGFKEGAISVGTSTNVAIKNVNVKASNSLYGVRADGTVTTTLSIENSSIEAKVPVVVRYATAAYNVALKGKNTLTSTDLYDVVFTNGKDDEDYVAPTGNWSITGAEGLNVYPTALTEGYNASSSEQLSTLLSNGATNVNLSKGIYELPESIADGSTIVGKPGTVITTPHNIDAKNVTFKNAKFSGDTLTFSDDATATFEGCSFDPSLEISLENIKGKQDFKFNNCTIESVTRSSSAATKLVELLDLEILKEYKDASYIIDGTKINSTSTIITSAEELIAASDAKIVAGQSVILVADIDLNGTEFNGLNAFNPENNNTFDGMGFVVSNWTNESGVADFGFIKNWCGPIKNLTIYNAKLKTGGRSAIIAAKVYSDITNCHVVDSSIEDTYWACGAIAGLYNNGNVYNCTVSGTTITSNGGTGGIVGVMNETAKTRGFYNCSIEESTVNNVGGYGESYCGALICGMINISSGTIEFDSCTYINNKKEGKFVGDLYYSAGGVNIVEK